MNKKDEWRKSLLFPLEFGKDVDMYQRQNNFKNFNRMAMYVFNEHLNRHYYKEGDSPLSSTARISLDPHTFKRLSRCLLQCKEITPNNSKLKEEIENLWNNLIQKRKHQL